MFSKYKLESYTALVRKILGKKNYLVLNLVIFFDLISSTVLYFFFSGQIATEILKKFDILFPDYAQKLLILVIGCLAFGMSFFNLQKLSFLSYIGNFFAFYISIMLIIQMYSYYESSTEDLDIFYFKWDLQIFVNIGIAFYGYVNQFAVVTILREIKNASSIGISHIMLRSIYIPIILYSLVCFAGYISFGKNIPDFIVLRPSFPGSLDIFFTIGQLGIFFVMFIGIIIRVRCNREIVKYFLKNCGCLSIKPGQKISKKASVIMNFFLTLIPGTISLFIHQGISTIVSLVSSIVCPYYIFIAPCNDKEFLIKRFAELENRTYVKNWIW